MLWCHQVCNLRVTCYCNVKNEGPVRLTANETGNYWLCDDTSSFPTDLYTVAAV